MLPQIETIMHKTVFVLLATCGALNGCAGAAPPTPVVKTSVALQLLSSAPQQWARAQYRLDAAPLEGANAYDPDQIAVDANITAPSGAQISVPLFWFVGYTRGLETVEGKEQEKVTPDPAQPGQWRLRWTPRERGIHALAIAIKRGDAVQNLAPMTIDVGGKAAKARGFVRVEPTKKRFFQTDDGQPLPLLGMNADWPGKRGTFDYDDWLPAMGRNGMNFTRLWQGNAGFRAELYGDERLNYSQPTLWQLDTVFDLAAKNDVDILLALGFHGEFQTKLDSWGHQGWWKTHAYNTVNGGPAEKPNDFFTNAEAAKLYQKRLRYLVARYGANPNLLSWEFFNEVDNIYGDAGKTEAQVRDENLLYPPDVVAWHAKMGQFLKSIDPYGHLVTTSFGSAGEQTAMWQLPAMDFVNWHWYSNWGGTYSAVTQMTGAVGQTLGDRYDKPVLISEFGTDGRGWAPETDAERRGLRQAIWGGVFAGTAGGAMPWWWESVDRENLYPLWKSLRDFLPADYGSPAWKTVDFGRPDAAPDVLGALKADAKRFSQRVPLTTKWGKASDEAIVINREGDVGGEPRSGYVYGNAKPELHAPFTIQTNVGEGAKLVLHLNSVSTDPILVVKQNGKEIFREAYPNIDGKFDRNNEYNRDIAVPLQPGAANLEIANVGQDWLFLDWVRVDGVLESDGVAAPVVAQTATKPGELGTVGPDAKRFSQKIALNTKWGKVFTDPIIINQPGDGDDGARSGYVHGNSKANFRTPFVIKVNVGEGAKLVMHLNSVATAPIVAVGQNGKEIFRRALDNKDGKYDRNNEFNQDIEVPLQAGAATIQIANFGEDWYFLDWVRVDGALQTQAATPTVDPKSVPLEHSVLSDGKTRLLWIVDSRYSWPRGRSQEATPLEGATLTLPNWPDGAYDVQWWNTRAGQSLGQARVTAKDGTLELPIITFSGDVAAKLTPVR